MERPVVPGAYSDLMAWLTDGSYLGWEAETEVHPSTQGPNGVRIYLNSSLVQSLDTGASKHPVGAMGVRELYKSDLQTLDGFALAIKTRGDSSEAAQNWFWFEVFSLHEDSEPIIAEHGAQGCASCHSEGVDFIRSTYPLR